MNAKILIVIPARGGSKGIPRKNLRNLAGKPLIWYAIHNALVSKWKPDVYVSTDDDEIRHISEKFGAKIHPRDEQLAQDATTLDPVIHSAMEYAESENNLKYDYVVTLQPTSPLLKTSSLDEALKQMIENPDLETILSAVNDTHLTWLKDQERYVPNYEKRVNRQYLPQIFKETGGFFITRRDIVTPTNRIGSNVGLYEVSNKEAIDIDTFEDWSLCAYYLNRKRIVFNTIGYPEIGLGHIYRSLILANDIVDHELIFVVDEKSDLGYSKIAANNYNVLQQKSGETLLEMITGLDPFMVINDCLDTDKKFISELKTQDITVVNFEDLGEGSFEADLVFNALYEDKSNLANHYFGNTYFCARDEFLFSPSFTVRKEVKNILISFGGVDPNNLTFKVVESVYDYCLDTGITITVVAGLGYQSYESLAPFPEIIIKRDIKNISDEMLAADIVFTSAGRTTYELALLGVPAIVLAQNERELSHYFAGERFGFINLGKGIDQTQNDIRNAFNNLMPYNVRSEKSAKMLSYDLRNGKSRVINLITELLN